MDALEKNRVSVMVDIEAHQVQVEEVKEQILNLLLLNCNSYQVRQPQVSELLILEEKREHIFD